MHINILAASDGTPLTKTFAKNGDEIITTPYPFVKRFDSFSYEIDNLQEFRDTLESHANQGHCLLKGRLNKDLNNESRAGHTNAFEKTTWHALDCDFDTGFENIDAFLAAVDPALTDCSYILHHSSSSGIKRKPGLSAHIYVQTEAAFSPELLKLWLIKVNLDTPALRSQIRLSKNGLSLVFPLDITTCQNDKLLFIADPICRGLDDPMAGKRLELVQKSHDTAPLRLPHLNAQALRDAQDALVAKLRADQGLKKRAPKYKRGAAYDLLTNPDEAVVTGVKEERGFIYLNLNGGDSWGYYFRQDNPELLHNFKGEPVVRLADIAPDFYKQYMQTVAETPKQALTPFVFRQPDTDTYWNGVYNASADVIESLHKVKSKDRMKDFLAQYDMSMPDIIEDWTLKFDPRTNTVFDANLRWVNLFRPTTYMKDPMPSPSTPPRVITKVLRSICVDDETFDHFINWLAYIMQTRKKTGTAWIFHGVPGTGKGILQEKLLMPLFGAEHVSKILTSNLNDNFNGYMERAIFLLLDEAKIDAQFVAQVDKLKNIITEDTTTIRIMRTDHYAVRNFVNLIIATNHTDPIPLNIMDRRFNVAPAQETPLVISKAEISMIEDELPMFAGYLRQYEVDVFKATHILKNAARDAMIEASETSVDRLFREFNAGNLNYFIDFLRDRPSVNPSNTYIDYERTIKRWAEKNGQQQFITSNDLMKCYLHLIGGAITPAKFGRICTLHHLTPVSGRVGKAVRRGWHIKMHSEDTETIDALLEANVTELRSVS
jgi:hypothetical protein